MWIIDQSWDLFSCTLRGTHVVKFQDIVHAMHKPVIELFPTELGLTMGLCEILQVGQALPKEYCACIAVSCCSNSSPRSSTRAETLVLSLLGSNSHMHGLPGSTARCLEPGWLSLRASFTRSISALSQEPSLISGCLGITSPDCAALVAAAKSLDAALCTCK